MHHAIIEVCYTLLHVAQVASDLCIELLDVYELDRAAGFYTARHADFHVPPPASVLAALAAMLQLRVGAAPQGERAFG